MVAFVKLTRSGVSRVINGDVGSIYEVKEFRTRVDGRRGALVIDHRFPTHQSHQCWSLNADDFEVVYENTTPPDAVFRSNFARLDVTTGRHALKARLLQGEKVDVMIRGRLDNSLQSMAEDAVSIEFSVDVSYVQEVSGAANATK